MKLVPCSLAPALASPSTAVRSRSIRGGMLALILAVVMVGAAARPAPADPAPQPSPYPVSWEFKFTHGTPKRLLVDVFGKGHTSAYWYMTYTVTNPGDQPIDYLPDFRMLAENGKVIKSDSAIPREVFDAVVKQEGNKLLQTARKIEGPLNAGEDQAKDGVAIWPEPAPRMGSFSIFCRSLAANTSSSRTRTGTR